MSKDKLRILINILVESHMAFDLIDNIDIWCTRTDRPALVSTSIKNMVHEKWGRSKRKKIELVCLSVCTECRCYRLNRRPIWFSNTIGGIYGKHLKSPVTDTSLPTHTFPLRILPPPSPSLFIVRLRN